MFKFKCDGNFTNENKINRNYTDDVYSIVTDGSANSTSSKLANKDYYLFDVLGKCLGKRSFPLLSINIIPKIQGKIEFWVVSSFGYDS